MNCRLCGRDSFAIVHFAWIVCMAESKERGAPTIHESFYFGAGSPMDSHQAQTAAKTWSANLGAARVPDGRVVGIFSTSAGPILREHLRGR